MAENFKETFRIETLDDLMDALVVIERNTPLHTVEANPRHELIVTRAGDTGAVLDVLLEPNVEREDVG